MPSHLRKKPWKQRTAVVCGASSGLGRAMAVELANGGVGKLALLARDAQKLEAFRNTLLATAPNSQLIAVPCDVLDRQQLVQSVQQIQGEFGGVDLVLNAVGQSDRGTIMDLQLDNLQRLWEMNLASSLNVLQCFRPALQPDRSTLVLIGSLASLFAPRFLGGYAIAKHALAALAQQARLELAVEGIHVMLACPGPIRRSDAGERYSSVQHRDLPAEAMQPGGGARVKGLDAQRLAGEILYAAARRKPTIIRPRRARILLAAAAISPRLGDYLLKKNSS